MRQKIFNRRWVEKEKPIRLVSSLTQSKEQIITELQTKFKKLHPSRTVELKFISQISGLQSDTQQQQELAS